MKRIAVTGSRIWDRRDVIENALGSCLTHLGKFILVHGGCETGADAIAHDWARRNGIRTEVFFADWYPNGKLERRAGPERNIEMAESKPDMCIAFPLGGPGTEGCVDAMRKNGVETHVYGET